MAYKLSPRKNRSVYFNQSWINVGESILWDVKVDDPNLNCDYIETDVEKIYVRNGKWEIKEKPKPKIKTKKESE